MYIFLPFSTLLWVLIHTLGNTGLDQLTNRCVKAAATNIS